MDDHANDKPPLEVRISVLQAHLLRLRADVLCLQTLCGDFNTEDVALQALRGEVDETANAMHGAGVMVPCEQTVPEPARFSLRCSTHGCPAMFDDVLVSRTLLTHYRGADVLYPNRIMRPWRRPLNCRKRGRPMSYHASVATLRRFVRAATWLDAASPPAENIVRAGRCRRYWFPRNAKHQKAAALHSGSHQPKQRLAAARVGP